MMNQFPRSVIAAPERGGAHWGWIAAFGLGLGGAYTLWSGFIEPSLAQASQAGFTQGNVLTTLFFTGAFWKGWDAMRSVMEFLAVATLGTVALWLLRKQLQRFTAIAFVAGALVCALAAATAGGSRGRAARQPELHAAGRAGGEDRSHRGWPIARGLTETWTAI